MKQSIKTLTIVVPLYNEGQRVDRLLTQLERALVVPAGFELKEVRLVDDGSIDNTLSILRSWARIKRSNLPFGIKVMTYGGNRGRGFAVRQGLTGIRTDYGLYVDADMSIPLNNLLACREYAQNNYDVIIGSKKKPGARAVPQRGILRQIVGFGHTAMASMMLGTFVWDFQGGFKMFSKRFLDEMLAVMSQDRWGFDMEVIYLAKKNTYLFGEIPVIWGSIDEGSTVRLMRDIRRALADMITIRWTYALAPQLNAWLSVLTALRTQPAIRRLVGVLIGA